MKAEIENIGPVEKFDYEMPTPGLWVLRGKHGCGKSTILRVVQLIADGRSDMRPTKRDGTARGTATIGGKTLRVTSSQIREDGELGYEGVGDLNITDLHSPKFETANTRDRHRIKALARLAGVKADAALFHTLVGSRAEFERLVDIDALETDDLVEMAARIKRSLEKTAQRVEADARTARSRAQAAYDQAADVDTTREHDADALSKRLTDAVANRERTYALRRSGVATIERVNAARQSVAKAQQNAPDLGAARETMRLRALNFDERKQLVANLEYALAEARAAADRAGNEWKMASQAVDVAERHAETIAAWQAEIDAGAGVVCPTEQDVQAADELVTQANSAVTAGVKIRQAIQANEAAARFNDEAKANETVAQRLRDAARDTQDRLSDAIARISGCPLRVRNDDSGDARLVLKTDRADDERFDDLSDGERWQVVVPLALGEDRIIVLPQAAYGELSDSTRDLLDRLAKQHKCYIHTAQVDDAELRCEAWLPMVDRFASESPAGLF